MELWEEALQLEHYIRDYVPAGWTCSLEKVTFIPIVLKHDVTLIKMGVIPAKFNKAPMSWAIKTWFNQNYVQAMGGFSVCPLCHKAKAIGCKAPQHKDNCIMKL